VPAVLVPRRCQQAAAHLRRSRAALGAAVRIGVDQEHTLASSRSPRRQVGGGAGLGGATFQAANSQNAVCHATQLSSYPPRRLASRNGCCVKHRCGIVTPSVAKPSATES
jgi:hypothetical protein